MDDMLIRRCGTSLSYELEFAINNPPGTINIMKIPHLMSCYRIQVRLDETRFYIEDFSRRSLAWKKAHEMLPEKET